MNAWDRRFQNKAYIYGKEPNEFVVYAQNKLNLKKGSLLAVAEGEGRNAVFMAEKGLSVTAWDYAEEGLKKTQALAAERHVHVQTALADLTDADWMPEAYDAVVNVFGHIEPAGRESMLEGIKSTIKPGGYYISEVYSKHQLPYKSGGPPKEDFLYDAGKMLETFKGWKIIHFFTGEVTRQEGKLHNGLSHVIQIIAQKI
ncbi:tellurite resistance methyltransferase [Jeotgalibacillus malaysiensis]|uniref:Tellurite resistance methyltransferase n=1 Tax=Jeotgalibacillus malaysiensis TaxID=1508404 RepID=A0A0B5AVQ9_9BACL|nr:class I SAM-dependent methyltransferase [Jeotgalibacillus malaysiensis]AJD92802.1 tellurite resistance methyltransferase [Jeotgalibacillus malaysiensis]